MDHVLDWKPDIAIFHPTCKYMAHSGVQHLYLDFERLERDEERWALMERDALAFRKLLELPLPKIAVENPKMHGFALKIVGRQPDQIVHPYWFGDDASKQTGLWLKGLPRLVATAMVKPRIVNGLPRWANQTDSGQNNVSNTKNRWSDRSVTFPGVAHAFASQWTPDLKGPPKMKFMRYEVRPVIEQPLHGDGERGTCTAYNDMASFNAMVETCKKHNIGYDTFWSIYGVDEEGLSHCIGDYDDEEHAFDILSAILGVPSDASKILAGGYMDRKEARKALLALVEGSTQPGSL